VELGVRQELVGRMGYVDVCQMELRARGGCEPSGQRERAFAELGPVEGHHEGAEHRRLSFEEELSTRRNFPHSTYVSR